MEAHFINPLVVVLQNQLQDFDDFVRIRADIFNSQNKKKQSCKITLKQIC